VLAVRDAQSIEGRDVIGCCDRIRQMRISSHDAQEVFSYRPCSWRLGDSLAIGKYLPLLGVSDQEVAESLGHADYVNKPTTDIGFSRHRGDNPRVKFRGACFQKSSQEQERLIRIRSMREIGEKIMIVIGLEE